MVDNHINVRGSDDKIVIGLKRKKFLEYFLEGLSVAFPGRGLFYDKHNFLAYSDIKQEYFEKMYDDLYLKGLYDGGVENFYKILSKEFQDNIPKEFLEEFKYNEAVRKNWHMVYFTTFYGKVVNYYNILNNTTTVKDLTVGGYDKDTKSYRGMFLFKFLDKGISLYFEDYSVFVYLEDVDDYVFKFDLSEEESLENDVLKFLLFLDGEIKSGPSSNVNNSIERLKVSNEILLSEKKGNNPFKSLKEIDLFSFKEKNGFIEKVNGTFLKDNLKIYNFFQALMEEWVRGTDFKKEDIFGKKSGFKPTTAIPLREMRKEDNKNVVDIVNKGYLSDKEINKIIDLTENGLIKLLEDAEGNYIVCDDGSKEIVFSKKPYYHVSYKFKKDLISERIFIIEDFKGDFRQGQPTRFSKEIAGVIDLMDSKNYLVFSYEDEGIIILDSLHCVVFLLSEGDLKICDEFIVTLEKGYESIVEFLPIPGGYKVKSCTDGMGINEEFTFDTDVRDVIEALRKKFRENKLTGSEEEDSTKHIGDDSISKAKMLDVDDNSSTSTEIDLEW